MIGLCATLAAWAATPDPLAARAAELRAEHIAGLEVMIAAQPSTAGTAGTAALWHRLGEARADHAWVAQNTWCQVYSYTLRRCFSRSVTCPDVARPDAELAPATVLTLAADAEERDLLLARLARRLLENGFEAESQEAEALRVALGASL